MDKILVTRDTKGKIRIVEIMYEWCDTQRGFVIKRITSQYGGKKTNQPDIWIFRGKANRTVTEQCKLEFNSHVKKYLDKGYKELPDEITLEEFDKINEFLGEVKTNQEGILKPMLAKQADKVASNIFNKEYYGSRKINGTRCLIFYKDGEIRTSSRGAINYDIAISHIINHPKLIQFFETNPNIILDGEIYKHGWTLNKISGICRTQSGTEESDLLEFYLYDVVDLEKPFAERLEYLELIKENLDLSFDCYREWEVDDLKIQYVPHVYMTGWSSIKSYHDKYVKEGWEGLVIRNVKDVYGPGKRTNAMIKIKEYKDDVFKVVGIEQGLRLYEDMVFILETASGKTFKAKPMGDREQRKEYTINFESLYKGHLGECKYFEISPYGIPEQPCFTAFRFDLENETDK